MVSPRRRPNRTAPTSMTNRFAVILVLMTLIILAYFLLSARQNAQHDHGSFRVNQGDTRSASAVLKSDTPYMIYGTAWKKDDTARLVSEAIKSGFRFIDTACQPKHYNEAGVGEGWDAAAQDLGLNREDLSIQTKFTSVGGQDPENIPYDKSAVIEDQVRQSVERSLENLRTDYLDSLVLHSPMKTHEETMRVWKEFESFVDEGKVRQLGVSNCYDLRKFTKIFDEAHIKPSVLQNRFHAKSMFDTELRIFCKEKGIRYQSFWTLTANRKALSKTRIKSMAEQKGLTPQTLMYAFMLTLGHTPLSGTTDKGHMAEDVAVTARVQGGEQLFENEELKEMAGILGMPDL